MAWTEITRAKYRRDASRYASDLTDVEWVLVAPRRRRRTTPPHDASPGVGLDDAGGGHMTCDLAERGHKTN